jgi:DNA primase catalytic core
MIEQEKIDRIKTTVDMVALAEARGIKLKKNGRGYFGLCPFHDDKNPSLSINPKTNLWQCFGCGAAGDVIRFIELFDRVDFTEAVRILSANEMTAKSPTRKPTPQPQPKETPDNTKPLTVKQKKLLARVIAYYQHTLEETTQGLDYLKNKRGITRNQSLKDFGAGYVNGTLLSILPDDDQITKDLKSIGILNTKGNERFLNCVVFPLFDASGAVVNLYGRNIDEGCDLTHLYLPGSRSGLVNRQAVKRSQAILLTESVIDALTLYDQGFKNVMPLYGTNGLIDDHLSYCKGRIKEAYLVFDADDPGRKAAQAVGLQLKDKDITPYTVELPVKDVNIYFNRHTPEQFEQLLKQANPKSLEHSDHVHPRKKTLYKHTEQGFIVGYGERQYHVKGIQRGETQLKAVIKASGDVEGNLPFELTTIDLYSSRSRLWFAKLCADLFGAAEELVKEDIGKLLTLVESYQPKAQETKAIEPSQTEKAAATKFLKSPDMFKDILDALLIMGIVGEETNKIVCYLTAVSRLLAKPLSTLIQSRSGAGKSTLQNAILRFVPESHQEKYTRVTDQALFYKEEGSLKNKILAIEEEAGVGGAAYSIRNIQSEGRIRVAATGKDPGTGKMKTETYTVEGPVSVMLTTTAADIDAETASRFIFLSIDESEKMTAAIHDKQKQARTLEGLVNRTKSTHIERIHQIAQQMLKPVAVVNPFTPYLSYPTKSLISRRDHDKYLGLIEAIAFLHQYQRQTKTVQVDGKAVEYIEVTLDDVDKANVLANDVLGQSLDELARPSRLLLDGIYKMVKDISKKQKLPVDEVFFTRRQIRESINWTDWQIKAHIKQLEELEYLNIRFGARGKEYAYALNYKGQGEDNSKFYLNLTPVEEIKKLIRQEKKADK